MDSLYMAEWAEALGKVKQKKKGIFPRSVCKHYLDFWSFVDSVNLDWLYIFFVMIQFNFSYVNSELKEKLWNLDYRLFKKKS